MEQQQPHLKPGSHHCRSLLRIRCQAPQRHRCPRRRRFLPPRRRWRPLWSPGGGAAALPPNRCCWPCTIVQKGRLRQHGDTNKQQLAGRQSCLLNLLQNTLRTTKRSRPTGKPQHRSQQKRRGGEQPLQQQLTRNPRPPRPHWADRPLPAARPACSSRQRRLEAILDLQVRSGMPV